MVPTSKKRRQYHKQKFRKSGVATGMLKRYLAGLPVKSPKQPSVVDSFSTRRTELSIQEDILYEQSIPPPPPVPINTLTSTMRKTGNFPRTGTLGRSATLNKTAGTITQPDTHAATLPRRGTLKKTGGTMTQPGTPAGTLPRTLKKTGTLTPAGTLTRSGTLTKQEKFDKEMRSSQNYGSRSTLKFRDFR